MSIRDVCCLLSFALAFAGPVLPAVATEGYGKSFALVVAVKDYEDANIEALGNSENDANEFKARLLDRHAYDQGSSRGFNKADVHVMLSTEKAASKAAIEEKWRELVANLKAQDTIVFYFAGHGIELKGRSYFHVQDTRRPSEASKTGLMTTSSLDFQSMLDRLRERQSAVEGIVGIFIIDACRSNPFEFDRETIDAASVGLAGADMPSTELFILYSAGFGQKALDKGRGETNSAFAEALLEQLNDRNMPVSEIARRVKLDVYETAQKYEHSQTPAYYDQLRRRRTLDGGSSDPQKYVTQNSPVKIKGTLNPRDAIIECTYCPEVTVIPPSAPLSIKKFALGKFEVTNREWDAYQCKPEGCLGKRRTDAKKPYLDGRPVTGVSWQDAQN